MNVISERDGSYIGSWPEKLIKHFLRVQAVFVSNPGVLNPWTYLQSARGEP